MGREGKIKERTSNGMGERGARKPSGTYLLVQNKQRQPVTEQKGDRS